MGGGGGCFSTQSPHHPSQKPPHSGGPEKSFRLKIINSKKLMALRSNIGVSKFFNFWPPPLPPKKAVPSWEGGGGPEGSKSENSWGG